MQSNRDIVSETLLVKERGAISEKLASDFCLQLPGWCPCLNCRDFNPQPPMPRPVPRKIGCNSKEMLKLKRKAAAPKNSEVPCEKSCKKSTEAHIEAGADENDVESSIERFRFDCNVDELQKFKEGECPENTTKSNDWALRNFHSWRVAHNEKYPDDPCPEDVFKEKIRAKFATGYASLCVKLEDRMDKNTLHIAFTCC